MSVEPLSGASKDLLATLWSLRWRLGVLAMLCGAGAGLIGHFLLPPRYSATALLFITPDRVDLTFDPKFRNLPEDRMDLTSRRRTIELLATSDEVITKVLDHLGNKLPESDRNLFSVREMGDIVAIGEILKITLMTRDPALSAEMANYWASLVRELAAQSVSSRESGAFLTEERVKSSLNAYLKAQETLAVFSSGQDRSDTLAIALRIKKTRLDELVTAQFRLEKGIKDLEELLEDARNRKPGSSLQEIASLLSLLMVRMNTLESSLSASLPFQLQLQLDGPSSSGIATALAAPSLEEISRSLDRLRKRLETVRTAFSESKLPSEILEIQGESERLAGKRRELAAARDVAWETYMTISRKLEEARLASDTGTSAVRFASHAKPNSTPERSKTAIFAGLGVLAGLGVGLVFACIRVLRNTVASRSAALSNGPSSSDH